MTFDAANIGTYGSAPAPINTGKSIGADTTAKIGGTNARGQVLGVPEGYVPPTWVAGYGPISGNADQYAAGPHAADDPRSPQRMLSHPNQYREADAWDPASNPADIPDLQQKLIKAGLLAPTDAGYQPGLWGPNEVVAYKAVLSEANVYGVDAATMLNYMLDHPGFSSTGLKQLTMSSPISVQQAFEQAYKSALGKKPSNDQTAAFVSAWSSYENETLTGQASAQAAFAKNPEAAPKSITDVASPSDFAQNYIDTNFSGEEANVGYQHGLDLVTNLISGSKGAGG